MHSPFRNDYYNDMENAPNSPYGLGAFLFRSLAMPPKDLHGKRYSDWIRYVKESERWISAFECAFRDKQLQIIHLQIPTGQLKGRIMTFKGKKSDSKKGKMLWVNHSLTSAEKTAIKDAFQSVSLVDTVNELAAIAESGYKVSLSYSEDSEIFVASLACFDESSPNYWHQISFRGSTAEKALFGLCWKHLVLYGRDWSKDMDSSPLHDADF